MYIVNFIQITFCINIAIIHIYMFDEYISDIIYFVNIQIYMKIHGTILVESHYDLLDGTRVAS